jgi:hypothetical protein
VHAGPCDYQNPPSIAALGVVSHPLFNGVRVLTTEVWFGCGRIILISLFFHFFFVELSLSHILSNRLIELIQISFFNVFFCKKLIFFLILSFGIKLLAIEL